MSIVVVTTFPNHAWDIYAKRMLQSFMQYWPPEIQLCVGLDDPLLADEVSKIVNVPHNGVSTGWTEEHKAFVERNKGRDDPQDYRKQAVRFCHKVFCIKQVLDAIDKTKANNEPAPRYLVWLDADVFTTRQVTLDDIKACLPKEGDAVAYLGRKEWDHSECGWLAFDLENGGDFIIKLVTEQYTSDAVFAKTQWHDSWIWDLCMKDYAHSASGRTLTNLSPNAVGLDAWEASPMAKWSTHHKGPQAKHNLANERPQVAQPMNPQKVIIQTKNAIPHEQIHEHIRENQKLIKNWIKGCAPHDEEIVVVSAGPMMIAEEVREEVAAGRKIVAVKHAMGPLKQAGIKPWACILLDPRPHVNKFVDEPDTSIKWFVASQVDPNVTMRLLSAGCEVWGYHASVGAGEYDLTRKQEHAIVAGGSATATRGLYMLNHLGFKKFRLYGYDLCFPDKVDMNLRDEIGQPKYMEMSVGLSGSMFPLKRCFWTEPQLVAQFEELNEIILKNVFELKAFGYGIIPFVLKAKEVADLRAQEFRVKLYGDNPPDYKELLCRETKKAS